MFHRNKKKSNLSFLLFFVLIVTIFFWTKFNNDRYLKRYYISDLKKNSPRSKKNTEVLVNLKRAVILFLAIVILILLICIFFIFKSNSDVLKGVYSYFTRDEEYHIYNELAKRCEFYRFDFQRLGKFAGYKIDKDGILRGFAAIITYFDYFKGQTGSDRKFYFFRSGENSKGEKIFLQSSTTLNSQGQNNNDVNLYFLNRLVKKGEKGEEDLDEQIDENRKDTDYHDFLGIKNKKIDEIEKFSFFDQIFADIDLYFNDEAFSGSITAIKNLLFFNFFLDPMNRAEEDNVSIFTSNHEKINEIFTKKELEGRYFNILKKIDCDEESIISIINRENDNLNNLNNNDAVCDIIVRLTEEDGIYYIPDGIFISNLMDLYKKIISLKPKEVIEKRNRLLADGNNVPQISEVDVSKAKFFLCYFTSTVLQNYLYFLKKLMFIEILKKRYQKKIDKEAFSKFKQDRDGGDDNGAENILKMTLNNYVANFGGEINE